MPTSTTSQDPLQGLPAGIGSSACNIVNITPNDAADLAVVGKGFTVNVSGLVTLNDFGGNGTNIHAQQVIYAIAGIVYPGRITRVWATGTAATGISIWY